MKLARIVSDPLDVAALMKSVSSDRNGAVALFAGTVRSHNEGRSVSGIEYSAYEEMANQEMMRILDEAAAKFGVDDCAIEHRIGQLSIGDASIIVAVAHPHRAAALDGMRYIVEETKKRAPIWKLEHYTDGTREWVNAGAASK